MLFVDEVRKVMPGDAGDTVLDLIKHHILAVARDGGHGCVIDRPCKEDDLANEIQWLKDNGFTVEECTSRASYEYYPRITVKW